MRTIQITIFLFISNMIFGYIGSVGLVDDVSFASEPNSGGLTGSFLQGITDLIMNINVAEVFAGTLLFGFLLYVFKPMITILIASVYLMSFINVQVLIRIGVPDVIYQIFYSILLLFAILDCISYVSKAPTETSG